MKIVRSIFIILIAVAAMNSAHAIFGFGKKKPVPVKEIKAQETNWQKAMRIARDAIEGAVDEQELVSKHGGINPMWMYSQDHFLEQAIRDSFDPEYLEHATGLAGTTAYRAINNAFAQHGITKEMLGIK